ncbi:MAG: hypothetical protein BIFFINMI_03295 [Phycisphaerae bacterium]|nr:hypothetical protein [Phycisphaerae bacterium]
MELTVLQQVAAIQRMPLVRLRDKWRALFGTDAPAYSAEQMARRLAWRVQELNSGGLSEQAQRTLAQVAAEIAPAGAARRAGRGRRQAKPGLVPGTRLVRLWGGRRHEVTVGTDGTFEYAGRRYRSLTMIAKVITGAHHSGPRFFGLTGGNKEVAK